MAKFSYITYPEFFMNYSNGRLNIK